MENTVSARVLAASLQDVKAELRHLSIVAWTRDHEILNHASDMLDALTREVLAGEVQP